MPGPLKAEVAAALSGWSIIGLPGPHIGIEALDTLRAVGGGSSFGPGRRRRDELLCRSRAERGPSQAQGRWLQRRPAQVGARPWQRAGRHALGAAEGGGLM